MTRQHAADAVDEAAAREWWDVFISHATEEKAEVVAPLARKLEERGLRVWLDREQIDLGDNLRAKVNEGIARSRFAVAVLSARYLGKKWTLDELDAFMAREELGPRVVLPVLHGIEPTTLAAKYPLLANRIFGNTSKGLDTVADEVVRVVLKDGSGSPSERSPSLGRRFLDLLTSLPGLPLPQPARNWGPALPILDTSGRCDARTFSGASDRLHDRPVS